MNIYTRKQRWKLALLSAAILIGVTSLWYTNNLVKKLSEQEKKNVELWAGAVRQLSEVSVSLFVSIWVPSGFEGVAPGFRFSM